MTKKSEMVGWTFPLPKSIFLADSFVGTLSAFVTAYEEWMECGVAVLHRNFYSQPTYKTPQVPNEAINQMLRQCAAELERPLIIAHALTDNKGYWTAEVPVSHNKKLSYVIAPLLTGGSEVKRNHIFGDHKSLGYWKHGGNYNFLFEDHKMLAAWRRRCAEDRQCRKILKLDYGRPRDMDEVMRKIVAGVTQAGN